MKKAEIDFSRLPSIEQILQSLEAAQLLAKFGRSLVLASIRNVLDENRKAMIRGASIPSSTDILASADTWLERNSRSTLRAVINASGVILHTNMGRAPISVPAQLAISKITSEYNNLEFDLETGKRGSRICHIERITTQVTGAEAALVVCNNAAAVLLTLSALARGKRVVISRTQMVEIGDGFRVPEVMKQSGAKLVEIGATNRVHIPDYQQALEEGAAAVLRVHHSNFKLSGFTSEPSLAELVDLAHWYEVPLIDNLGSGALLDTAAYGMAHEPMVQESIRAGADLVCFSGDKLVGGPQAGIIVGKKELIARIRRHPLARAVRADKMCIAGLAQTILHYACEEAEREIPIWRMISMRPEHIKERAEKWLEMLGMGEVREGKSTVGGGSLPEEMLPTWLLEINIKQPDAFIKKLRQNSPPIIARIENDRVILDPRTVFPEQDQRLIAGLRDVITKKETGQ
jgi:L-seryl-tRNA(Ser) seleniumtransferase